MSEIKYKAWLIMDKDRKYLAVGTPRNREIMKLTDYNGKRILTYKSKKVAENGFKLSGFYCWGDVPDYNKLKLEAVCVEITIKETI